MYYSKHNVVSWWKTPRKTYVPNIFKNRIFNRNPKTKSNFRFNLSSFLSSSSFIRLLSFKRSKNKDKINKTYPESDENYDNDNESVDFDVNLNKSKVKNGKTVNFVHKDGQKKETVKKIHRKINKEDIKVACDDAFALNTKMEAKSDLKKNDIVIINTGLASTTNKNISKIDLKPTNNKIDNNLIKYQETSKVHNSIKNKNNLVIVNAGLSSTTNNNIKASNIKSNLNNDTENQRTNFKDLQNKFNQQSEVTINLKPPKC